MIVRALVLTGCCACACAGCQSSRTVTYTTPRLLENLEGTQEGGEDLAQKRKKEQEAKAMRAAIAKATGTPNPDEAAAGVEQRVTSASLDQSGMREPDDDGAPDADAAATVSLEALKARSAEAEARLAAAEQAEEDDPLVQRTPDGRVTMKAASTRDLIAVLSRVINAPPDDEAMREAFYEQLVSQTTKTHFQSEGKDPRQEVTDFLSSNRTHINRLLGRLPGGENSPGVIVTSSGRSQFKVELTGAGARGLKFTEVWVALEGGQWRLVWLR